VLLVLLAAAVCVGCGGGSDGGSGASTPVAGADGPGYLIYSRPDAIIEFEIATATMRELVRTSGPTSFLLDPAVSADGAQLAYVLQPPAQIIDGRYDAGTDLWVAARDGSGARMVYQHTQPNALVRYPRWTPDGDVIAIIQEITETAQLTEVAYTVQRIDIVTGERTKLLDDAYAIALSPDGSTMAYARPVMEGGERFEAVALDDTGGAVTELVAPSANLLPFNSPEYSPDGTSIAFGSADQSQVPTPPTGRLVSIAPIASATDGLPQDIWLVDAAGGRPRLLAPLKEDLPSLTWGGDGKHVYVLGGTGLYEIDTASGAVTRIGDGVFHGQIDWTE
jgi:Tol biopolymer transport system component